ncbi:MAG: PadR family transcriptional regulator [Gemmatimonadota bacterium]|nr:PadR family transcriptional regulator [Gemmatimonadota bacterium]
MGTSEHLGEFEYVVMLALARCGGEEYGAGVFEMIVEATGRRTSVPAVYVTLNRLEEKGYVRARRAAGATPRGGHRRKVFRLTSAGTAALHDTKRMFDGLWQGLNLGTADAPR